MILSLKNLMAFAAIQIALATPSLAQSQNQLDWLHTTITGSAPPDVDHEIGSRFTIELTQKNGKLSVGKLRLDITPNKYAQTKGMTALQLTENDVLDVTHYGRSYALGQESMSAIGESIIVSFKQGTGPIRYIEIVRAQEIGPSSDGQTETPTRRLPFQLRFPEEIFPKGRDYPGVVIRNPRSLNLVGFSGRKCEMEFSK